MSESQNGQRRPIAQALAVMTLVAAFTSLFVPVKNYIDRQDELVREVKRIADRITRAETTLEVIKTYPPPLSR